MRREAGRVCAAALAVALCSVLGAQTPVRAQGGLPPEAAIAIQAAARQGREDIARDDRAVQRLNDRPLAARIAGQARESARARLAAAVIAAIETHPRHVRSIVDLATASAPESRSAVIAAVADAYPGFAGRSPAAGARTATSPAPGGAPRYRAAPASGLDWYDQPVLRRTLARAAREAGGGMPSPGVRTAAGRQVVAATGPGPAGDPRSWFAVPAYMLPAYTPAGFRAAGVPRAAPPAAPDPAVRAAQARVGEAKPTKPGGVRRDTISDPAEPLNRIVFAVNDVIDIALLRPIAALYGFTPTPVKLAVRRALRNLREPLTFANDVLQFDVADAGTAAARFALNSTIGVAGLFDPAAALGLPRHTADFGQTMHSYGVGAGPYVVLPLFGPSTARDAVGRVADYFLDPFSYILESDERLLLGGTGAVVDREELLAPLDDLRATAVDHYAALRGVYYQDRAVELAKGRAGDAGDTVDRLFDEIE